MAASPRCGARPPQIARLRFTRISAQEIMKRFSSILIAAASLACATNSFAATRPHYGGTLRVSVQTSAQTFEPAIPDGPGLRSLTQLVFETLVKLDDRG